MEVIYFKRIKANLMDIEQVPPPWREQVQAMLDAEQKKQGKNRYKNCPYIQN